MRTEKYKGLTRKFNFKYKLEAQKHLEKNVSELKDSNPGKAYSVLKKMGAQPGDRVDSITFTLPGHESHNLTAGGQLRG